MGSRKASLEEGIFFFFALNDRFKEGKKIGGKHSTEYTIIISIHVMIKVLINFLNKIEIRFCWKLL